jgi:outer membrane receptor for ferrienterochelin and colicins
MLRIQTQTSEERQSLLSAPSLPQPDWPRRILFVLSLFCWLAGAHSQTNPPVVAATTNFMQLSLEQLLDVRVDSVYGASKYQQRLSEAPSSVSIVTEDDIKKYGYQTLADVLRSVRGLYVSYDRNYSYLGMRGFSRPGDYNGRVLLLINGHRVNDNIYDSAFLGNEFPLDLDLIDRVEVIRGPSSSIYGNNALFGVINIITKQGRDFDSAEVSGEAGSFDSYQG